MGLKVVKYEDSVLYKIQVVAMINLYLWIIIQFKSFFEKFSKVDKRLCFCSLLTVRIPAAFKINLNYCAKICQNVAMILQEFACFCRPMCVCLDQH